MDGGKGRNGYLFSGGANCPALPEDEQWFSGL